MLGMPRETGGVSFCSCSRVFIEQLKELACLRTFPSKFSGQSGVPRLFRVVAKSEKLNQCLCAFEVFVMQSREVVQAVCAIRSRSQASNVDLVGVRQDAIALSFYKNWSISVHLSSALFRTSGFARLSQLVLFSLLVSSVVLAAHNFIL
jgi:hypothetical protein